MCPLFRGGSLVDNIYRGLVFVSIQAIFVFCLGHSTHYIMIKGSIQEDITIINIYAPNIAAPQYVRQMLTSMKEEINNNTIIAGDFNMPLTPMDRSTKQKINKETHTLNDTMDQLDLIDSYRTFHPKTMNFTFFSRAHKTFSRIDHILGHKSSLGKFKKKLKSFQASFLTTMQ